jgi:flagellar biosynthesis/type III secretory pathway protein FliH
VIPAEEAHLHEVAWDTLAAERREVDAMWAAAADAGEAERRRGFEAGRAEGITEATELLAQTAAGLQRELVAMERDIALAIAEGVAKVVRGLDLAEQVVCAARRAVRDLQDRTGLVLRVAPGAGAAVRTALPSVQVVEESGLNPDDCIVETAGIVIRAGVQTQLDAVRRGLLAALGRESTP